MHSLPPAVRLAVFAASVLLVTACGGDKGGAGSTETAATATPSPAPSSGTEQTPDAGGQVITVQMVTADDGTNRFEPATFDAKKGDVIRYTLKAGVHNVHFVADSNAGKSGLPGPSDMLQLPGQTYDVKVAWEPGSYYYQCDPHALLGMVGRVTVK